MADTGENISQARLQESTVKETGESSTAIDERLEERLSNLEERYCKIMEMSQAHHRLSAGTGSSVGAVRANLDSTALDYFGRTIFAKFDLPRFYGNDVEDWVFRLEQIFSLDQTPENVKINLASLYMEGEALTWHRSITRLQLAEEVNGDWNGYKNALFERFDDMKTPIAELKNLREIEGITEYHKKFEQISARISLLQPLLVRYYLEGLNKDMEMYIREFRPQTIKQCFKLGTVYESEHPRCKGTGLVDSKTVKEAARKVFSAKEMSERQATGLCDFCEEKYTEKHKQAMADIYEINENKVKISAKELAGVSDYNTMKVRGVVGKESIDIFISTGCPHNFIDVAMAERFGYEVKPARLSEVKTADGKIVNVSGKVEAFKWCFQEVGFKAEVIAIALDGCDMLLGAEWIKNLGVVEHNLKNFTMKFMVNDRKLKLKGIK